MRQTLVLRLLWVAAWAGGAAGQKDCQSDDQCSCTMTDGSGKIDLTSLTSKDAGMPTYVMTALCISVLFSGTVLKQLSSRCSKNKKIKNIKITGKYWSSYVQWRNLLLLTP